MIPDAVFWKGKKVLLTGHTGFKGGWLSIWLERLGADITGVALLPSTSPDLYTLSGIAGKVDSRFCDIRDLDGLVAIFRDARPEIVFHLAAQPLVRASYRQPVETFSANVMGTVNLLEAARLTDTVRTAVIVTTDKVYRNLEHPYPYREDDVLGGHDPYSASKAASEIVVESYRKAFMAGQGISVATARAGNVIGGGDWSEDRLIPDVVRAWQSGKVLEIRRPDSIRPWQHVIEPLAGYIRLAEKMWENPSFSGAYNFGPETSKAATVREVVELALSSFPDGKVTWGDGSQGPHEAGWLALEIARARTELGFVPRWNLEETVNKTMKWYAMQHSGADAAKLCESDIEDYEAGK